MLGSDWSFVRKPLRIQSKHEDLMEIYESKTDFMEQRLVASTFCFSPSKSQFVDGGADNN